MMTKTGAVEFEDGIFSDDKLRTGVAMQLVFDKKENAADHTVRRGEAATWPLGTG